MNVPFGITVDHLNILNANLGVEITIPLHYEMTTWDSVYRRLRENFDGPGGSYGSQLPDSELGDGKGFLEFGKTAIGMTRGSDRLDVTVINGNCANNTPKLYKADMVIAANGGSSQIRKTLQLELRRSEPKYIL